MLIKNINTYFSRLASRRKLRKKIAQHNEDLKVILGAGPTKQDGWVETDYPEVDITDKRSLARFFPKKNVRIFLAEHVLEHLTMEESYIGLENCYNYLMDGGMLRIAVPDGFHTDREYINYVKPGGSGAGSDNHKVLYDYKKLSDLFKQTGFGPKLLEWFDEYGEFHYQEWSVEKGFVIRSTRYDPRNRINKTSYTSLIIDGVKLEGTS
ncbi:MAG: hypothetical protein D3919_07815 [Candidatus Electrothrix sp. AW5]|nr:hypothetical protein [Candidatus Electrothrix gigas]